jgi:hypothetical protein
MLRGEVLKVDWMGSLELDWIRNWDLVVAGQNGLCANRKFLILIVIEELELS